MIRKNLIVFFVPPEKIVNGGILSIFSQCKETRKFYDLHRSEVVVCTYPGNETYKFNDLFPNNETVYNFDQIMHKWRKLDKVIFHIPETAVRIIGTVFNEKYRSFFQNINDVHLNIMTQNIELMRDPVEFAGLFKITPKITQTTAHDRYTTQFLSDKYQTPVHHLSVFNDKSQYINTPYDKKINLIIYSPDEHPEKSKIIDKLKSLERYEIREIRGLKYDEYKKLTTSAKFCISFGEGFDGYFLESFFSNSIGISVYNNDFFPDNSYSNLDSVFDSYKLMEKNLISMIKNLDDREKYTQYVKKVSSKLEKLYNHDRYLKKMERFYKGSYDILPQPGSAGAIIGKLAESKDNASEKAEFFRQELIKERTRNANIRKELANVISSRSWKITKPLRQISGVPRKTHRK
jgi:hypothetical protein